MLKDHVQITAIMKQSKNHHHNNNIATLHLFILILSTTRLLRFILLMDVLALV